MTKTFNLTVGRATKGASSESGNAGAAGGSVTTVQTTTESSGAGHTHENKADLDKITLSTDGYVQITQLSETTDASGDPTEETEKAKAGYADKAAKAELADKATLADLATLATLAEEAKNLTSDSPVWDKLKTLFLSKTDKDTAAGLITFLKGVIIGGGHGIDETGAATLLKVLSKDFSAGQNGAGFGLYSNDAGSRLEVDTLLVRKIATFLKLEIRELSYVGGNIVLSKTGSILSDVAAVYGSDGTTITGYKCYYTADDGSTATTNLWKAGDQAMCQTFDIKSGVYENVENKYYWRRVMEAGEDYVVLATRAAGSTAAEKALLTDESTAAESTGNIPAKGDKIVQIGYQLGANATDDDPSDALNRDRTNLVMLSTTGDNTPSIEAYTLITEFSLTSGQRIFLLSPETVTINSENFSWSSGGVNYPAAVYVGEYEAGNTYQYYQQVTYNGSSWICTSKDGVTEAPTEGSAVWQKYVSKGEQGDKGDSSIYITITSSTGNIFYNGQGTKTLTATVYNGTTDITAQMPAQAFSWTRNSGSDDNAAGDATWNAAHKGAGSSITIDDSDTITQNTVFDCEVNGTI